MKGKYKRKRERQKARERSATHVEIDGPRFPIDQEQPKERPSPQPHKPDTSMPKKWFAKLRKLNANEIALLALSVTVIIAVIYLLQLVSMQTSVTIQRKTMVVSQRAYVYAKHANIITGAGNALLRPPAVRQANEPITVDVTFSDSGQTWARNENGSVDFYFSASGIPDDFAYPETNHSQPVLIAPQSESHLLKSLSETDFKDVTVQPVKKKLFVYGTVRYQDIFGEWHKTEYCFQLAGVDYNPDGTVNQYLFWQGPTHNCADEDCKD